MVSTLVFTQHPIQHGPWHVYIHAGAPRQRGEARREKSGHAHGKHLELHGKHIGSAPDRVAEACITCRHAECRGALVEPTRRRKDGTAGVCLIKTLQNIMRGRNKQNVLHMGKGGRGEGREYVRNLGGAAVEWGAASMAPWYGCAGKAHANTVSTCTHPRAP